MDKSKLRNKDSENKYNMIIVDFYFEKGVID